MGKREEDRGPVALRVSHAYTVLPRITVPDAHCPWHSPVCDPICRRPALGHRARGAASYIQAVTPLPCSALQRLNHCWASRLPWPGAGPHGRPRGLTHRPGKEGGGVVTTQQQCRGRDTRRAAGAEGSRSQAACVTGTDAAVHLARTFRTQGQRTLPSAEKSLTHGASQRAHECSEHNHCCLTPRGACSHRHLLSPRSRRCVPAAGTPVRLLRPAVLQTSDTCRSRDASAQETRKVTT